MAHVQLAVYIYELIMRGFVRCLTSRVNILRRVAAAIYTLKDQKDVKTGIVVGLNFPILKINGDQI
ncbi:MAG TPA: hypothetical protein DCQ57_09660 [Enterobacteriaceae bacterium]|nr:hypothetical protein [Enterobacteriaceae bacterium]